MENGLRKKFEKFYKNRSYKDDELTNAVERFLDDPLKVKQLEELNEIGIPPAFAFIFITKNENTELFKKYLKGSQDYHQYFGELFGALFYDSGYDPEMTIHNNRAFLMSASLFRKNLC